MSEQWRTAHLAVSILIHRVLAKHAPYEMCPECPPHTQEIIDAARKDKDDERSRD